MGVSLSFWLFAPVVIVVLAVAMGAADEASPNCRKPPKPKAALRCCQLTGFQWSAFAENCTKAGVKSKRQNQLPTACMLDCIFNVSGVMDGETLQMANVRSMLERLLPENPEGRDVLTSNFEKCEPFVKTKLSQLHSKKAAEKKSRKCSMVAGFYSTCAWYKLLDNCPTTMWSSGDECDTARTFIRECAGKVQSKRNKNRLNGTEAEVTE